MWWWPWIEQLEGVVGAVGDGPGWSRGWPHEREERVVLRECACPGCSASFTPTPRSPAHLYCSASCRQKAYALRRARVAIDAGEAEPPTVLRETVCEVVPPGATVRDWLHLLGVLTNALEDPATKLAREHWHHAKLLGGLQRAAAALDLAHPGGMGRTTR